MTEMQAVQDKDNEALGRALLGHAGHVAKNFWRSLFGAPVVGTPPDALAKEARMLARLSAKYALTCDIAMGLLGGKLKRMELLSSRLGDCLAHLYMASATIWRYAVEGDAQMLPIAQSALRAQLDAAEEVLKDLYANLPAPGRRFIGSLVLSRTSHLAPLRDVQMLALAKLLRENPAVVQHLCPDVSVPKGGGLVDLMAAMDLAAQLGDDATAQLNKLVRRTHSFEEAAAGMPNPALALAYLHAADKVIQVDDFAP